MRHVCENCEFWKSLNGEQGECYRYPATVIKYSLSFCIAEFIATNKDIPRIKDLIDTQEPFCSMDFVTTTLIMPVVESWHSCSLSPNYLLKIFRILGYKPIDRVRTDAGQVRPWVVRNFEKYANPYSATMGARESFAYLSEYNKKN